MVGPKPAFSVRLIRGIAGFATFGRRTRLAVGPPWSPGLWSASCARRSFVAPLSHAVRKDLLLCICSQWVGHKSN